MSFVCPNCGDFSPSTVLTSNPAQADCPKCGARVYEGGTTKIHVTTQGACRHNPMTDCIELMQEALGGNEFYAEKRTEMITLFRAHSDDRVVGFALNHVSKIMKDKAVL